ncbi:MAG: fumarylacetoacetate hydrolase domain protein 2A [SAR86 cluster bacterium SAR86A]|jgi:2-keto-4-pentenoate hydratase/2-oxohepta-3-ene-1,7-dioic acid hydratase in catechol pathway|uniref:Fumarylacetoacetate hydrolase domain protein 2A n=1 Tax=SAR86 cluster bacterium SAR86A TaxID=1123866 RepID=J5K8I4_9GAMM|nr:MAG: fumarylacetoacetate hydrolase domain protein 2A [SAR86 cluster bacterium SAR86A]|tara:strand:+ start:206 stop:1114 length:909 start_codon:yes stop_codon:yes gene_type:complete
MKLITFLLKDNPKSKRIGAIKNDTVIDFSSSDLPKDMINFIKLGSTGLDIANDVIENQKNAHAIDDVILKAPIDKPNKILAVGLNYKKHIDEAKELKDHHSNDVQLQDQFPNIFNKQNSSVNDPFGDVHRPNASDWLDYEGELGFIIGKECRHVSYENAKNCIYGYTVVNDFSIRDWQFRGPPHTMTMGKSWDTHCPFGPYIVTSDEIDDPHNLTLKTFVNDEERQNTNTNLMIYDCYTLIEYLTTAFTLEPGDLIPTGTPEGSAVTTQNWLKPGDKVKVEIEGLGYIENNIIQEPNNTQKS